MTKTLKRISTAAVLAGMSTAALGQVPLNTGVAGTSGAEQSEGLIAGTLTPDPSISAILTGITVATVFGTGTTGTTTTTSTTTTTTTN